MTRAQLLRRFVLNAICDDTEDLEMIYESVYSDPASSAMRVERPEIVRALLEVIEGGHATAYRLIVGWPHDRLEKLDEAPPLEEMETPHTIYYGLTPKGKELHLSQDDGLPWDGAGGIREGWSPPTE
jgi:hypothetical protein